MLYSAVQTLKQYLQSHFQQAQITTDLDSNLVALPDILDNQIAQKLQTLASPTPYCDEIRHSLTEAIATWQQNLDAPNSLVFLGSPVEAIADILNDSLRNWVDPPANIITPLPCIERPHNPWTLKKQIKNALEPYAQLEPLTQKETDQNLDINALDNRRTLILVPCLEQCFLRCIGGWESIEYLRDVAIHHRNCFWVMGCNHWAWNFLDFVCQVSAYFSEIKPLPTLDGEMLKDWLDPVVKTVIVSPEKAQNIEKETDGDRLEYWEILAKTSLGVSSIAKNLWLQSLRLEEKILAETDDLRELDLHRQDTDKKSAMTLHEVRPSLPSLPSLSGEERYLLHSLLIHGKMTRPHLAFSLGQKEGQIQADIQALLRKGLIISMDGALAVQPSHYAKLKTELANNNFFVGDD